MPLLRSNVEFAKRVFIDRLTTDQQGLLQPDPGNIDEGPGDEYEYGGAYDPFNLGVGADCSGSAGIFIGAAMQGPAFMKWGRQFSTETFPGGFSGFRKTTKDDLVNGHYAIKVCIMHGGGGPDSHMNCSIDGVVMESNGDHGTCTLGHGAIPQGDNYWNDWWVYDDGIANNTTYRTPMSYPQGVDYAGGAISGADLAAAGKSFVCRYVSDGGAGLPGKLLRPGEFQDLLAHKIAVVFNWETTATMMLGGQAQGVTDAHQALNYIMSLGGVPAGYKPVIYFSADFDASPDQQGAINDYLKGAGTVLGGWQYVGIYGGFWPLSRALDADVCKYAWQTEAWSGSNVDSRVHIMQRNGLGFQTIGGIQCDINEAHNDDFGQFNPTAAPPPGGDPPMAEDTANLILDQLLGPLGSDGKRRGWAQLGGLSVVDYLGKVVGPALAQIQVTLTSIQSKPTPPPGPVAAPLDVNVSGSITVKNDPTP